jgi:hypothetical protein
MTGSRAGGREDDRSAAEPPSASPDYQHALDTARRLLGPPLALPLGPGEPASGADFRRLATVHTFGAPGVAVAWMITAGHWSR